MKKLYDTKRLTDELSNSVLFKDHNQDQRQPKEPAQPVKSESQLVNNSTSKHVNIATSQRVYMSTTQLTTKEKKRFTSFLTPQSLKRLRQKALDTDADFHDLLQEAVDSYLNEQM